jgi:hypothetical protein
MEQPQAIRHRVIPTWFGNIYAPVFDNRIAPELAKYGYWEHSELFRFGELVRSRLGPASSTGMIIEVGCNIGSTVTIPCRSLDQQEYQELKAIKIDVEGMEHLVLAGAVETIRKHRPIVLFENHKTDMDACKQILSGLGYRLSLLGGMLTWAEYDLWSNGDNNDIPKTQ